MSVTIALEFTPAALVLTMGTVATRRQARQQTITIIYYSCPKSRSYRVVVKVSVASVGTQYQIAACLEFGALFA